jgi:hypothetical protein
MTLERRKAPTSTSFEGTAENPYPIFNKEIDFIRDRRKKMAAANQMAPLQPHPTTENGLVGLCFSGGGIRSATFNLGLLQSLYKHGILQRVDYLSTVSGGGYIGSCLTSLLNSPLGDGTGGKRGHRQEQGGAASAAPLWEKGCFPFSNPTQQVPCENRSDSTQNEACRNASGQVSAEKAAARHLRYFSNYLTAEGDFIRKYLGPVLAVTRGLLFNFLLIVPLVMLAGIGLALLYQAPALTVNDIPLYFNMERLESALVEHRKAEARYTEFVYRTTPGLGTADIAQRVPTIKADPSRLAIYNELKAKISAAHARAMDQWKAMLTIPLATLFLMMACAFIIMQFRGTLKKRYSFSYIFSFILFFSLLLGVMQVFGAAIVYWNQWQIPNILALVSLLAVLGPRLAKAGADKSSGKKAWVKIGLSLLLMSLTPLILLYFTGWFVNYLLTPAAPAALLPTLKPLNFGATGLWSGIAIALLYVTNRWVNVNKISLHNFYRDRLSRAYLIQSHSPLADNAAPVDRVEPKDRIFLSSLYEGSRNAGPYPIINTNLNLTKQVPDDRQDGVFRNCESFMFSKYWCGSKETGYIATTTYEKEDKHFDLAAAMAISGAAANVGMGHGNAPATRLLMGLLNVRLGYWAPNPGRSFGLASRLLLGNTPGGLLAMSEWIGRYTAKGDFINLSDGGHFDNLGVYELLRRRCKYIIVGDAEADPKMQFQALAYIIRLARIDFGVEIEIDTARLKPDKETGLSHQHCTVGIVNYPRCGQAGAEQGYLLYCKSCLSGDEPEHLHEYRVTHPAFPHQTTADQWFDERQFEVYRELGFHVGNTTFKPVIRTMKRTTTEDLFISTKEFWQPRSLASKNKFTQHARELNRIMEIIKSDTNLAFMDDQLFPEWKTFMSGVTRTDPPNLWLPFTAVELRAGFYVCNLMIQLMENVYLDLNLETEHDHPDNRGWMNMFMHWAWSGIFQVSWAISACTYGAKFQKFCASRLGLDIEDKIELVAIWESKGGEPATKERMLASVQKHLNAFELGEVAQHIAAHQRIPDHCVAFKLMIKSPLTEDARKEFCFGFALLCEAESNVEIDYFRVQDHLRKMGLGRKALEGLVRNIVCRKIPENDSRERTAVLDTIKMAPWIANHADETIRKQFNAMLTSVIAAIAAE